MFCDSSQENRIYFSAKRAIQPENNLKIISEHNAHSIDYSIENRNVALCVFTVQEK